MGLVLVEPTWGPRSPFRPCSWDAVLGAGPLKTLFFMLSPFLYGAWAVVSMPSWVVFMVCCWPPSGSSGPSLTGWRCPFPAERRHRSLAAALGAPPGVPAEAILIFINPGLDPKGCRLARAPIQDSHRLRGYLGQGIPGRAPRRSSPSFRPSRRTSSSPHRRGARLPGVPWRLCVLFAWLIYRGLGIGPAGQELLRPAWTVVRPGCPSSLSTWCSTSA